MRLQALLQACDDGGMLDDLFIGRVGIADYLPAGMEIGPRQQPDERTILSGDQRVLHDRRRRSDRVGAQRADMHEGAGGELEVLDDAAGEDDALQGILGIDEHAGIADAVKSFFVERGFRQIGSGRNSRA